MVTVAVAGGTGGVGRTIVDALKESGKHKVIVLSRKAPSVQDAKIPVIPVDYDDVNGLAKAFEDNSIELLISTIFIMDEASKKTEINLAKAADQSSTTKRFIISNWGVPIPPEELRLDSQNIRQAVIDEVRRTSLEWTQFYNGFFLDYYGMPYIESNLNHVTYVIDIANKAAVIPGTGDERVSLTYTKDLAKFVLAVIDLLKWEDTYCLYSVNTTWNKFVKKAEETTGTKFNVAYDSVEKLKKGEITEMPSYANGYHMPADAWRHLQIGFGLFSANGVFAVPLDGALNNKFPEIKTLTLDDVLDFWKGK